MNTETKGIIRKYNLKLTKKFGQNFLIDQSVIDNILECANLTKDDLVIEIGPGIGNMTKGLLTKAGHVVAIEIDKKLIQPLKERLREYDNLDIINQDVLKTDIETIINDKLKSNNLKNVKVVANLPYYITTPIIMGLLEQRLRIDEMLFMVQKEVALRMVSNPGKKDYGALSISVQMYTKPSIQFEVSPESFIPQPEVYSTIIKLVVNREFPVKLINEEMFFKVVKASFAQRRKKLLNGLFNSKYFMLEKEDIAEILEEQGIDLNERGENLTLMQFSQISNAIYAKTKVI